MKLTRELFDKLAPNPSLYGGGVQLQNAHISGENGVQIFVQWVDVWEYVRAIEARSVRLADLVAKYVPVE